MSGLYKEGKNDVNIRPGQISDDLREALNIGQNELPIWIYRMRALGYPPGWLRKAEKEEFDIFESDTIESSPQSNGNKNNKQVEYDPTKFISYPGFNSPLPEKCVDYHYYYNMPPMLPHQQLEYARAQIETFEKPAKRIKIEKTESLNRNQNYERQDEINDPASPEMDESHIDNTKPSTSSSIIKLETSIKVTNESIIESNELFKTPTRQIERQRSEVSSKIETKHDKNIQDADTSITLISKASPMPQAAQKPSLDKFSEGMTELLYFQNLPNCTGVFKGLQGLLTTIRKKKTQDLEKTNLNLSLD